MDGSCLMSFDPWVLRSTKSITETRCGGKLANHFFLAASHTVKIIHIYAYHWLSLISCSILPQASEHAVARGRSHQCDGRGRKAPRESQEPESLGEAHEVVTGLVKVCRLCFNGDEAGSTQIHSRRP